MQRTPCLFIQGVLDPVIELFPYDLFTLLPDDTHQIVFEASGHFPMLMSLLSTIVYWQISFSTIRETPRSLQLKEEWKRRVR